MDALITDPFYSSLFVGLGMILFLLEVFIPSFGVLGLFALGFAAFGIYGFFKSGNVAGGFVALALSITFAFSVVFYILRRLRLSGSLPAETCHSVDRNIPGLEGRRGVSLSPLRPAGLARIDGKRIDVVASGKFIDKGRTVQVVETSGNRVVVRETSDDSPKQETE